MNQELYNSNKHKYVRYLRKCLFAPILFHLRTSNKTLKQLVDELNNKGCKISYNSFQQSMNGSNFSMNYFYQFATIYELLNIQIDSEQHLIELFSQGLELQAEHLAAKKAKQKKV